MPMIRTTRRKSAASSGSRRNSAVAAAPLAPARVGPARAAKAKTAAAATPAAAGRAKKATAKPAAAAEKKAGRPAAAPAPPRRKKKAAARAAAAPPPPPLNAIPSQPLDVYTFGTGGSGELGLGADAPVAGDPESVIRLKRPLLNPVLAAMADAVVQVSTGGMHCAAVTAAGRVVTWGVNDAGALGRATDVGGGEDDDDNDFGLNKLESTPTVVPEDNFGPAPVPRFAQVAATDSATFALSEDGNVWGWGTFRDQNGIFGFLKSSLVGKRAPSTEDKIQLKPVRIPGLPANSVTAISGGSDHVLALTSTGDVYAWGGSGAHGELGRRLGSARGNARYVCLSPQHVALPRAPRRRGGGGGGGGGRPQARAVFAGRHHNFALTTAGALVAWGANNYAQAGVAPPSAAELASAGAEPAVVTPAAVPGLDGQDDASTVVHVAGGSHHSVACVRDGSVLFWGRCEDGQAGMDTGELPAADVEVGAAGGVRSVRVPTVVPDVAAVRVAAGSDCTFAVAADGHVHAWGYSDGYRTGLGTDKTVDRPREISRDANKVSLADKAFETVETGGQFTVITGPSS